jgi:hypothetical protein
MNSFEFFLSDMGLRPSPRHSIERTNNDKGYQTGNCRWATKREQTRNMRSNRLLTHDGRTMCVADWATHINIHHGTLRSRLSSGWSVERTLTTPIR